MPAPRLPSRVSQWRGAEQRRPARRQAGDWLKVNGEAIYKTRPMPLHWNDTASSNVRGPVAYKRHALCP